MHRRITDQWRRHPRIVLTTVVLVLLATVVAWALAVFRAPIGGSVDSSSTGIHWTSNGGASPPTADGTDADCAVTLTSEVLLTIGMTLAYPDSSCLYTAGVKTPAGSDEPVVVTGLTLTGLPTGWTAGLAPGVCGTVAGGTYTGVSFDVIMTETAAVGSGATLSAATSGVLAVPESQFEPSMCP